VVIPGSIEDVPVTAIDYGAFGSLTNVTKVTIHDNIKEIGEEAFWECTSLTMIGADHQLRSTNPLFNACQCVVETLMFYHPVTWWITL